MIYRNDCKVASRHFTPMGIAESKCVQRLLYFAKR